MQPAAAIAPVQATESKSTKAVVAASCVRSASKAKFFAAPLARKLLRAPATKLPLLLTGATARTKPAGVTNATYCAVASTRPCQTFKWDNISGLVASVAMLAMSFSISATSCVRVAPASWRA